VFGFKRKKEKEGMTIPRISSVGSGHKKVEMELPR
jgi:hypothetical protein